MRVSHIDVRSDVGTIQGPIYNHEQFIALQGPTLPPILAFVNHECMQVGHANVIVVLRRKPRSNLLKIQQFFHEKLICCVNATRHCAVKPNAIDVVSHASQRYDNSFKVRLEA